MGAPLEKDSEVGTSARAKIAGNLLQRGKYLGAHSDETPSPKHQAGAEKNGVRPDSRRAGPKYPHRGKPTCCEER